MTQTKKPIYIKNSKAFYNLNGKPQELGDGAPIVHKNNKKLKGTVANLSSFNKTGYQSSNSQNVYKFKNQYYVMKNGKFTAKFKGKAILPPLNGAKKTPATPSVPKKKTPAAQPGPVVVPVPVQVPVVKPDASHLVAPKNARIAKLGLLLKAIAARKKKAVKESKTNYHTEYCQNYSKGYLAIGRTNTLQFVFSEVKGFTDGTGSWKDSLDKLQWKTTPKSFGMSYRNRDFAQHLLLKYYPPMKNFKNFDKSKIIDMTWYQKQNKWLRSLSPREVFLLYGFSHNGDVWAHTYLDGKFSMQMFTSKVKGLLSNEYFALFFQARDFYKINTGDIRKDYSEVLNRVGAETNQDYIKSIIQMFIDELNALCAKAPATTKPFVVWRGVKDDTYMSGIKDKQYTLNRFASTTVNGDVAFKFGRASGQTKSHTVQRILIMPGSRCVLMFGMTKYSEEFEILLPRGSTYIIRKTEKDIEPLAINSWNCQGPEYPPKYNSTKHVKNLVDIILLGQSKKFLKPSVNTVTVPVVVPPSVLTNVQKMQKILNNQTYKIKVLNKIGQGGAGVVFKGSNSVLKKNVAIKLAKFNKNFEMETRALINLRGSGVTPKTSNFSFAPWSQNAANLIPKGLPQDKKAGILVMNLINGKPLRSYTTGPPLNKALKNKVVNAVGKVSAAGWLHGNLHRNNIIINKNGKPMVIDFGKAIQGPFKTTTEANKWLKGLGKGLIKKYGKEFYYSNNAKTQSHYSNKNFLNKLI